RKAKPCRKRMSSSSETNATLRSISTRSPAARRICRRRKPLFFPSTRKASQISCAAKSSLTPPPPAGSWSRFPRPGSRFAAELPVTGFDDEPDSFLRLPVRPMRQIAEEALHPGAGVAVDVLGHLVVHERIIPVPDNSTGVAHLRHVARAVAAVRRAAVPDLVVEHRHASRWPGGRHDPLLPLRSLQR